METSLSCGRFCVELLSKKGPIYFLFLTFFFDFSGHTAQYFSKIEKCNDQIYHFMDHKKRDEALRWIDETLSHTKSNVRLFLLRRVHQISCLFLTNKTFQIYQEGHAFLFAKKYKLAQEKFEQALSEEPDNVEILTRLGQSLFLEGDFDGALKKLNFAMTLNSHEFHVKLWLGLVLLKKKNQKALLLLQEVYGHRKDSEQGVLAFFEALRSFMRLEEGVRILEKDLKKNPFHFKVLVTLVKTELLREKLDYQRLKRLQKYLQLALGSKGSALSQDYRQAQKILLLSQDDLGFDVPDSQEELKTEMKHYLKEIEFNLKSRKSLSWVHF